MKQTMDCEFDDSGTQFKLTCAKSGGTSSTSSASSASNCPVSGLGSNDGKLAAGCGFVTSTLQENMWDSRFNKPFLDSSTCFHPKSGWQGKQFWVEYILDREYTIKGVIMSKRGDQAKSKQWVQEFKVSYE